MNAKIHKRSQKHEQPLSSSSISKSLVGRTAFRTLVITSLADSLVLVLRKEILHVGWIAHLLLGLLVHVG